MADEVGLLRGPDITRGRRALARRYYGREDAVKAVDKLLERGLPHVRDGKQIAVHNPTADAWVYGSYLPGLTNSKE